MALVKRVDTPRCGPEQQPCAAAKNGFPARNGHKTRRECRSASLATRLPWLAWAALPTSRTICMSFRRPRPDAGSARHAEGRPRWFDRPAPRAETTPPRSRPQRSPVERTPVVLFGIFGLDFFLLMRFAQ